MPHVRLRNLIPEHVCAFALGLYSANPEIAWREIVEVISRIGMGTFKETVLVSAADAWASRSGFDRSAMARAVWSVQRAPR
jgi:hypothetical protein